LFTVNGTTILSTIVSEIKVILDEDAQRKIVVIWVRMRNEIYSLKGLGFNS